MIIHSKHDTYVVPNAVWLNRMMFMPLLFALCLISACASTGDMSSQDANASEGSSQLTEENASSSSDTANTQQAANTDSNTGAGDTAPPAQVKEAEPPRIVESCKAEPYTKYEQQARASMKKGLQATKEARYGVGFRSVEEHNQWSEMHTEIFKQVNASCDQLSKCAKENKKDKNTKCMVEAERFRDWQNLAKSFADKVKQAESIQPPKLCSLKAKADDPSRCFHARADNIDQACNTAQCAEISACWRSVGFLDTAISQARQSCGFVHTKLSDCRAFTEASGRRKAKFEQCVEATGRISVPILPAL